MGKRMLRHSCAMFLTALCVVAVAGASAQNYPSKSIRIIVPAPPGGGTDLVTRIVGQKLAESWGQPVVIDNRGGAGAIVGTELAAKASPDGYTLVVPTVSHVTNPNLYRNLSYDAIKDFAVITQLTSQAYILVVPPSLPVKTIRDFIALAKSKKGGITYASSGTGQAPHLGMELLKGLAGFVALHIPYKGTAPAIVDTISGQVDASMGSMPGSLTHVRSGKLKALAVTSLKRSSLLPEVPSIADSGFPGYEVDGWKGLLAPAGTAREIVAKIHGEMSRILKLSDVKERMAADGSEPVGSTPQEFAAYLDREMVKWAKVIKQSGARAD